MCIRITERYSVCKCIYHVHGIDPCQSVGHHHRHKVQDRIVLVGSVCSQHASAPVSMPIRIGILPDSLSTSSFESGSYR